MSRILLFVLIPLLNQGVNAIDPQADMIHYRAIGHFHSGLDPSTGAPRQGGLASHEAVIELKEEYAGTLRGLESYDYIIVLYHLHLSSGWKKDVHPPGSRRSYGLFATRTPRRPNPIGFGVLKLGHIEGLKLHVSGVDAFDGTPVLDIKPWIPSVDCPGCEPGAREESLGINGS